MLIFLPERGELIIEALTVTFSEAHLSIAQFIIYLEVVNLCYCETKTGK